MVAKNDNAHRLLSKQLKDHTVVRRYVALVHGLIPHEHGKVDAPIGRNPKDRQSMAVTRTNSKEAVTNFTVLNMGIVRMILVTDSFYMQKNLVLFIQPHKNIWNLKAHYLIISKLN